MGKPDPEWLRTEWENGTVVFALLLFNLSQKVGIHHVCSLSVQCVCVCVYVCVYGQYLARIGSQ